MTNKWRAMIAGALAVTAAYGDHLPVESSTDDAVRYRTHISGPIAPVNRQMTHRHRELSSDDNKTTTAGGALSDWSFEAGASQTDIDDRVIGSRSQANEYYLHAAASLGDDLSLGMSIAYDDFRTPGAGLRMETTSLDFYLAKSVNAWLDVGVLTIVANSEINVLSDDVFTYGAGPFASVHRTFAERFTAGATVSVNFYDVDGTADTLYTTLLDLQVELADAWSATVYGNFNDSLRETPDDRTFWTVGGELSWRPSDAVQVSIGYETTLGFTQYDDDAYLLNVTIWR